MDTLGQATPCSKGVGQHQGQPGPERRTYGEADRTKLAQSSSSAAWRAAARRPGGQPEPGPPRRGAEGTGAAASPEQGAGPHGSTITIDGTDHEIYDLMGKDATLFHHQADTSDDAATDSLYVSEALNWFDSVWNTVAQPMP